MNIGYLKKMVIIHIYLIKYIILLITDINVIYMYFCISDKARNKREKT